MKRFLTLFFLLPCFCAFAQNRISKDSLEKIVLAKAHNDPEYKKVVADVNEVKNNIQLSHEGKIKADFVVKDYNTRLGEGMGKKRTLAEVEDRINSAGEKFIKYILLMTSSRIATEDAKKLADSVAKM